MPGDRPARGPARAVKALALVKVAAVAPNRMWWPLNIWLFSQRATILGLVGPAGLVFIPTLTP